MSRLFAARARALTSIVSIQIRDKVNGSTDKDNSQEEPQLQLEEPEQPQLPDILMDL